MRVSIVRQILSPMFLDDAVFTRYGVFQNITLITSINCKGKDLLNKPTVTDIACAESDICQHISS